MGGLDIIEWKLRVSSDLTIANSSILYRNHRKKLGDSKKSIIHSLEFQTASNQDQE